MRERRHCHHCWSTITEKAHAEAQSLCIGSLSTCLQSLVTRAMDILRLTTINRCESPMSYGVQQSHGIQAIKNGVGNPSQHPKRKMLTSPAISITMPIFVT